MGRRYTEPKLQDHIFGLIGTLFWYSAGLLPSKWRWHLGGVLGSLLYLLNSNRRNVVKRNLELCFPEMSQIDRDHVAMQVFRFAGRGLLSWGFALFASDDRIKKEISWHGRETLETYLDSGKPVILLCPHLVSPMLTLRAIGELTPVVSMYEPPRNPIFDQGYHCALNGNQTKYGWVNRLYRKRGRHSIQMISSLGSMRPFYKALDKGTPFFLLPDQNAKRPAHRVFVPFFGVNAATYTSLTRFVRYRNARVFLCFSVMNADGSGHELHTEQLPEEFISGDLEEDARRLNATIEKLVRRAPEQYFWLHKRFKTRPPGEPSIY